MSPNEGNTEHGVSWTCLGHMELLLFKMCPNRLNSLIFGLIIACPTSAFSTMNIWHSLEIYLAPMKRHQGGAP